VGVGEDAAANVGEGELRVTRDQTDVALHGEREADADGMAVDGGDHGLPHLPGREGDRIGAELGLVALGERVGAGGEIGPTQKALPAPVRMTARTSSRASLSRYASASATAIGPENAFRSAGRSSVSSAMPSAISTRRWPAVTRAARLERADQVDDGLGLGLVVEDEARPIGPCVPLAERATGVGGTTADADRVEHVVGHEGHHVEPLALLDIRLSSGWRSPSRGARGRRDRLASSRRRRSGRAPSRARRDLRVGRPDHGDRLARDLDVRSASSRPDEAALERRHADGTDVARRVQRM
jgi:hypothetical protein